MCTGPHAAGTAAHKYSLVSAWRSYLESVELCFTTRNAPAWTPGQGVMRHGRRIKAGFVKHKKPKGIIPTDS